MPRSERRRGETRGMAEGQNKKHECARSAAASLPSLGTPIPYTALAPN